TDISPTHIYTLSLHDALPILFVNGVSYPAAVDGAPIIALLNLTSNLWGVGIAAMEQQFPRAQPPREQIGKIPFGKSDLFPRWLRSEEHTSELQSRGHLVCRLL